MPLKFDAAAYNFRKKCPFIAKDLLRWFPGHMNKGLKQMQRKLKSVDCVIEVHDSRIPFTGRNPIFTNTITGAKPHILVLNKKDLTISSLIPKIKDQLKAEQNLENVVFTNSKDQYCRGLKTLKPLMVDLIKSSNRYNRSEELDYNIMIIGVPNVGKSSLINMLRSRNLSIKHALPVGAVAGVTRSLMMKIRINNDPKIFMLDTPGKTLKHLNFKRFDLKKREDQIDSCWCICGSSFFFSVQRPLLDLVRQPDDYLLFNLFSVSYTPSYTSTFPSSGIFKYLYNIYH